jgi:hypothetical protein
MLRTTLSFLALSAAFIITPARAAEISTATVQTSFNLNRAGGLNFTDPEANAAITQNNFAVIGRVEVLNVVLNLPPPTAVRDWTFELSGSYRATGVDDNAPFDTGVTPYSLSANLGQTTLNGALAGLPDFIPAALRGPFATVDDFTDALDAFITGLPLQDDDIGALFYDAGESSPSNFVFYFGLVGGVLDEVLAGFEDTIGLAIPATLQSVQGNITTDIQVTATDVSEPGALALFGLGLMGLAVTARRKMIN